MIVPINSQYSIQIIDILNYYIKNTPFTFIDTPLPYSSFDLLVSRLCNILGLVNIEDGIVNGFVLFKNYSSSTIFNSTCEMGIYIKNEYKNKGIGTKLLNISIPILKQIGYKNIICTVSSLNPPSILFHCKNGFKQVGQLYEVGTYKQNPFDVILFQKEF